MGPNPLTDGKDPRLLEHVRGQAEAAVREAAAAVPVRLTLAEARFPREFGLLYRDRRDPVVVDDRLVALRAKALSGETVAILVNGAVHPETLGQEFSFLSSDFPHFLREGLEKGGFVAGGEEVRGWGGTALYFSGALGGLPTTLGAQVLDEDGRLLPQRPFEKARRIGELGAWGVAERVGAAHPSVPPEPAWAEHAKGATLFVLGLANDELGYVVPANDFVFPRYLPRRRYGTDRCGDEGHYEETLSASSRLAPLLSQVLGLLLEEGDPP